jgi:hypothetical protein
MIFLIFLFACSNAVSDLSSAKQMEEEGDLSKAFDHYVEIKKRYPRTEASDQADKGLQRIYSQYAESKIANEPDVAIAIYKKMAERWKAEEFGVRAQKAIKKIASEKVEKERKVNEQSVFCNKARAANSRVLWQQYKQNYPQGTCLEEAERFLSSSQPREREFDEMRQISRDCKLRITSACQEYRISKTTSYEGGCQKPSKAFNLEFERLVQRKNKLLADGNQEYYESAIITRWDSLTNSLDGVCKETKDYISKQTNAGIDIDPLKEISSSACSICYQKLTDIRNQE